MSDSQKFLSQLVDVIALSKKTFPQRPIQAQLVYATKDNFVGQQIEGYTPGLMNLAIMTKDAGAALCDVQKTLVTQYDLGLLIYDTYRPRQAVQHFVRWSQAAPLDEHELTRKKIHYPDLKKPELFEQRYVSAESQHCFGHTVDLVLIDKYGNALDHGTAFDYMGSHSHHSATAEDIGAKAFENRQILLNAMEKHGFVAYPYEYWHYSFHHKAVLEPMDIAITADLQGLNVD